MAESCSSRVVNSNIYMEAAGRSAVVCLQRINTLHDFKATNARLAQIHLSSLNT